MIRQDSVNWLLPFSLCVVKLYRIGNAVIVVFLHFPPRTGRQRRQLFYYHMVRFYLRNLLSQSLRVSNDEGKFFVCRKRFVNWRSIFEVFFFFWALILDPPLSNSCRTNLFIYCSFGVSLQMGRAYASLTVKVTGHSFIMNASPLCRPLLHLLRDGSCINARLPWTDEISLVCVTSCLISCHTRRGGFYHSACVFQNVSDVQ